MHPQSSPLPAPKTRWLPLAAAAALATFGVWLACQRLTSSGRAPAEGAFKGRIRGAAPDFWRRDHAAGRAEAQQTGRPIFLVIRCEP